MMFWTFLHVLIIPVCWSDTLIQNQRIRRQATNQALPPLQPFTCKIKFYEGTLHRGDLLHYWSNVPNVNDCIGYCAQFVKGNDRCRAVNYYATIGRCDLLSRGSPNPSAEPVPQNIAWANLRHAVLLSCDNVPPPTPPPTVFKTNECGKQFVQPKLENSRNRIINGDDAVAHSWPWVVSVRYFGKHVCGGSLIPVLPGLDESDIVMTAAHCVKSEAIGALNSSNLVVVAGSHSQSQKESGEQAAAVESAHWHDYFMSDGLMNDIAIIKLRTPIKFSRTILPVCLPSSREAAPVDGLCVATGWGRYISNGDKSMADKLQQLRVPIVDSTTCKTPAIWGGNVNTATMLCAGTLNGKQNVCGGDSGGALMCRVGNRWVQHGIVSFVYRQDCAAAKKPGVYTRVSMYRNWVDDTIGKRSAVYKKARRQA